VIQLAEGLKPDSHRAWGGSFCRGEIHDRQSIASAPVTGKGASVRANELVDHFDGDDV
jgi:hypothetical protein